MVNPKQRLTNFKIGQNIDVVELLFPKNNKHPYKKSKIRSLVKKQQDKYEGKPLKFMISVNLPGRGWRSAKQFRVSEEAILLDDYDDEYDDSNQFAIYVWKETNPHGGRDKHNDCFFKALYRGMNGNLRWKHAYSFKRSFKIERDDLFPFCLIAKVEDKCKTNINVTGDYCFTTAGKYSTTIHMKLLNEHYTLDTSHKSKAVLKRIDYKEKHIVMGKLDDKKKNYLCYDGENEYTIKYEEMQKSKYSYDTENAYVLLCNKENNIQEHYQKYIKDIDAICKASDGVINYRKCSGNTKVAVLRLFYNRTIAVEDPDPIAETEEYWIREAFMGGLIYSEKTELENAISYDVNSAYPFFISKSSFRIPLKEGTFLNISELPKILGYGIYTELKYTSQIIFILISYSGLIEKISILITTFTMLLT